MGKLPAQYGKDLRKNMLEFFKLIYTEGEILDKRNEIARRLMVLSPNIKSPDITRIAPSDLRLLFDLYDQLFLNGQFFTVFPGKIIFSLSGRLSKVAGKTICLRNMEKIKPADLKLEIRIGTAFLFQFDEINSAKSVAGIPTENSLEALQLVFEHELCHVLEFITWHKSSCRQKRFKTLAQNLFGHTASTHQLPTSRQIAEQKYGFKLGDTVSFSYENRKYEGILYRVNKRATVMVRDKKGTYRDKQGNKYACYYVPLEYLE